MAQLRNQATLAEDAPESFPLADGNTRGPQSGDLWVDGKNFVMYVYNESVDSGGTLSGSWIGVTDKSKKGSIVYFQDLAPTLTDMYPALGEYVDQNSIATDPLPGTMWYDTANMMLKLWIPNAQGLNGAWIAVTSAHLLTQTVQSGLESMEDRIEALEASAGITP